MTYKHWRSTCGRNSCARGKTVCTFPLWDGGELIAYTPEVRAFVYAGLRMQPPDTPNIEEGKP
jgi:hypothetical protein